MSGYVDDLSEEQERTLRWLQSTLRKKAESPDYASLVPHNYLQEVEDDSLLLRFCRARKWDRDAALNMAEAAFKWRESFQVMSLKEADLHPTLLKAGMFYYVKDAYDKLGRPVALVLVRNHDKSAVEEQPMRNFTIYQMEVARRLLPPGVETVTIIFDMKDFGIKNMDLAFVKFMVVALERYYPESLGRLIIYNAPWIFNGFWKMISPLLDENVAAKIQFVSNRNELLQFVDDDNLPRIMGGKLPDMEHPVIPSKAYPEMDGHTDVSVMVPPRKHTNKYVDDTPSLAESASSDLSASNASVSSYVSVSGHSSSRKRAESFADESSLTQSLLSDAMTSSPFVTPSKPFARSSDSGSKSAETQLFSVSPSNLQLLLAADGAAVGQFVVKNLTKSPLAFKIKTTSSAIYVQPNVGIIPANGATSFAASAQVPSDNPTFKKKLLVQAFAVDEETNDSLVTLWATVHKELIFEQRISCECTGARVSDEKPKALRTLSGTSISSAVALSSPEKEAKPHRAKQSTASGSVPAAATSTAQGPVQKAATAPAKATVAVNTSDVRALTSEMAELQQEITRLKSMLAESATGVTAKKSSGPSWWVVFILVFFAFMCGFVYGLEAE